MWLHQDKVEGARNFLQSAGVPLPIAAPCAICFSFTELLSRVQLGICFQMLFGRVRTQLVVYQPVHVHVVILPKYVTLHVSV